MDIGFYSIYSGQLLGPARVLLDPCPLGLPEILAVAHLIPRFDQEVPAPRVQVLGIKVLIGSVQ